MTDFAQMSDIQSMELSQAEPEEDELTYESIKQANTSKWQSWKQNER